jgi:hypothetical protein
VQRFAHDVIAAPEPALAPAVQPVTGAHPGTPTASDPPGYRLCVAWMQARKHGTRAQQATAFGRLASAAGGAGKVPTYCAAAAHPGTSPSGRPHPQPSPGNSGKPSSVPSPHGSGKPSSAPSPHGSGKPSELPTQHGSSKPSAPPTPHGSGKPETATQ